MTLKILLPLDGTSLSMHQVRFAIGLTQRGLRASFVVANVQEPASFYEVLTTHDPAKLEQLALGTAEELMAPAVKLLADAGLEHDVMMVQEGDAVQGMLELIESERCDMVIIGAHSDSILQRLGARSSSLRLAGLSPVPVLSVKEPEVDPSP